MKKYKIHFVCRGNIYRSRLAEACMKSLDRQGLSISSSGISSHDNPGVSLSSYGDYAARHFKVREYVSPDKIQTSQDKMDAADVIIFMNTDVYQDASANYRINPDKCVVWDIKDVGEMIAARHGDLSDADALNRIAVETYTRIRDKVAALADEIDRR